MHFHSLSRDKVLLTFHGLHTFLSSHFGKRRNGFKLIFTKTERAKLAYSCHVRDLRLRADSPLPYTAAIVPCFVVLMA